ncbi:coiled-coil alpha-helical rod protein 1 [Exaiptasia diaphana]|uniref:Coiled-coil alpha-helical rod protein 1 n=1 Tax=Exaiptasia diaphana TaxID=2652724 RepID=A0A913WT58_EXADI|nr:coiled-coil alpha-helical rod protein 1 [Exaiptasia diaphana]
MIPFMDRLSSNMEEAFSRLGSLSQRVSFATGRVQFLQGLFAHKQAKWKNEMEVLKENTEKVNDGELQPQKEFLDEITRLTQERDMLACQAVKDAELLECRVENVRTEYEDKIQQTASTIKKFETELRDERKRTSALKEKVDVLQADLQESNETLESLKIDLARHDTDAEKKLSTALSTKQAMFTEEMADLEKQLNGVRAEHTKTLVALRQAEHQLTREKEKAKEQIALQQKEFDIKIEQLEKQARNLEKERNMLMATVRQEGIVISRSRPKHYQTTTDKPDIDTDEKENKVIEAGPEIKESAAKGENRNSRKTENVKNDEEYDEQSIANALHDLKFLSEALLSLKDDHIDGMH